MNLPGENEIEFGVQTTPSDQKAKTPKDCPQWRTLPSPTFILSTASTTTNSAYWDSKLPYDTNRKRSLAISSGETPELRTDNPSISYTSGTSLKRPTESFYTVVSLKAASPIATAQSFLFECDPTFNHTPDIESPSTYDQQLSRYGLFVETPANAIIARPSPSLSVAEGTVANERRRSDSIAMRDNLLYRLQRIVASQRKCVFNYLLPLCLLTGLMLLIYAFRDTAKGVLYWIETQNTWIIFVIFLCMFTIVSFPVTVGYLVLIIASGYLFGFVRGLLTVMIGANLGVAIAHNTIKSLQNKLPVHKLIKNETGRAILRVISGPRAFKIVLFARLTPIPFGLQNTIFGISSVNTRSYHAGTVIGLFPAQTINVYLGSKLRSIHEVLNDHNAALGLAGYGVFVVEVIVGAALMVWVIQKARLELSAALLATTDADSDEKILIEIEA